MFPVAMESSASRKDSNRHVADNMQQKHLLGFQKLNQVSFIQMVTSCPTFIVGVVTLIMALPHIEYPVFNFGPVVVSLMVFPMALTGLLATRKATENSDVLIITSSVKCMVNCNFMMSLLCATLAGVSSLDSFYTLGQCTEQFSTYYEYCLPNVDANIALATIDGVACLLLSILSISGSINYCYYGFSSNLNPQQASRVQTFTLGKPLHSKALSEESVPKVEAAATPASHHH